MKIDPSRLFEKSALIVIVSLTLGFLNNFFFFDHAIGLSFPVYVALCVVSLFVLARFFEQPIAREVYFILMPLVFLSAMVAVRESVFLTVLNVLASVVLLLLLIEIISGGVLRKMMLLDYARILLLPFRFLTPIRRIFQDVGTLGGMKMESKMALPIARGILIAIPILLIFSLLFSSADLVFEKYFTELFRFDFDKIDIVRVLWVVFFALFFIGAFAYGFRVKKSLFSAGKNEPFAHAGRVESLIVLGSLSGLFFIFILLQFAYLFGGDGHVFAQGLTYAEYARRGFFELIVVAVISFILLLAAEKIYMRSGTDHFVGFRVVSSILVVEVFCIMASSYFRLYLYESAYGFTLARLFSHACIFLLGVVFCILLYKIHKDRRDEVFAFRTFLVLILFVISMNLINPDAFIARRNIEMLFETGHMDYEYVFNLSDDAIDEVRNFLVVFDDEGRKKNLHFFLIRRVNRRGDEWPSREESRYYAGWRAWNFSRMKARDILRSEEFEYTL